jgi:hypothetical protein
MSAKECPYWPTIVTLWAFARSLTAPDLDADLNETSFKEMVGLVNKPVINMESAATIPCQALADWKTLDDLAVPKRRASFSRGSIIRARCRSRCRRPRCTWRPCVEWTWWC